jgi:hypothetical protein
MLTAFLSAAGTPLVRSLLVKGVQQPRQAKNLAVGYDTVPTGSSIDARDTKGV